jgi:hypothetical protein
MDSGTCVEPYYFLGVPEECSNAATDLGLADTITGLTTNSNLPTGCYYKNSSSASSKLWFNSNGVTGSSDTDRRSICSTHEWSVDAADSGLIEVVSGPLLKYMNSYDWEGTYNPAGEQSGGKPVYQRYASNRVIYWGDPVVESWGKCWIFGTSLGYRSIMSCSTSGACRLSKSPDEAELKCGPWMVYSTKIGSGWSYLSGNDISVKASLGEYPTDMFENLNKSNCASNGAAFQDVKVGLSFYLFFVLLDFI